MNLNSTLGAAYTLKGALPQGMKEPKPPKAPTMSKKPGMPEFPEGDSGHPDGSAIQSGPDNEPTPSVGSARWVNITAIGVVIGAAVVDRKDNKDSYSNKKYGFIILFYI